MKNFKRKLYLTFARRMSKSDSEAIPVPSIISVNTKVIGNISSKGIIHIDGKVEGDVTCEELIIGVKGSIIGSVVSNNLQIYGVLQGKAKVDSLFIAKTASRLFDKKLTFLFCRANNYTQRAVRMNVSPVSQTGGFYLYVSR